jgi:hypothetical protein
MPPFSEASMRVPSNSTLFSGVRGCRGGSLCHTFHHAITLQVWVPVASSGRRMHREGTDPLRTHTDPPLAWSWLDGEGKGKHVWEGGAKFCDSLCVVDGADVVDTCSADQECAECSQSCAFVRDCKFGCMLDCQQCMVQGYYKGGIDKPPKGRCARECGWMRAGGHVDGAYVPWTPEANERDCSVPANTYLSCPSMVRFGAVAMMTDNRSSSGYYARMQAGEWTPAERLAQESNEIVDKISIPDSIKNLDQNVCLHSSADCRRFWYQVLNVVVEFEKGYSDVVEWDACGAAGLCDCFNRRVSTRFRTTSAYLPLLRRTSFILLLLRLLLPPPPPASSYCAAYSQKEGG